LLAYGCVGLVTSEENLSGYMIVMMRRKTLYPNIARRVSGFLEAAKGHNVTIGFGIRSYDTWWASVIAFQLAQGKPKYWTPRSCRHLVQQPRRWRHAVAEMAAANPNTRIVVWPYEDYAASPGNILGHLSNGRLQTQDTPDRKNQRPDMARIKHRLRYFWLRSKKLVDEQGRFQPFTQGQQSILRDHYAKDIEWFCTQTDYNNIEFLQRSE
jgi:hypothetical protein